MDETGEQKQRETRLDEILSEMQVLAREIGAAWTSDKSAAELVNEQRQKELYTC